MTSQRVFLLLVMFWVHAKFQVRVQFASMCFFVDNLSAEEEEEEVEGEGEERKKNEQ